MSAYLARLKQLENEINSLNVLDPEPPKPAKGPFDPFVGKHPAHFEKKVIDAVKIVAGSRLEQQRESRRQEVITILQATPNTQRAIYTDIDSDPRNVILTVAVRNLATCEMLIPKSKYDPWRLLELIEWHGQATHIRTHRKHTTNIP